MDTVDRGRIIPKASPADIDGPYRHLRLARARGSSSTAQAGETPVTGEHVRPKLAQSEADLSKLVCDIAHDLGWMVFRLPIAKGTRPVKDAKGYPDLTLARNHNVLWIELKVNGNGMSTEQMEWMRHLGPVVLVTDRWSREEVRDLFA